MDRYSAVIIVSYHITGRIYNININGVSKDQLHKTVKDQLYASSITTTNKMNKYFDQVEALTPGELAQATLNGLNVRLTVICWTS